MENINIKNKTFNININYNLLLDLNVVDKFFDDDVFINITKINIINNSKITFKNYYRNLHREGYPICNYIVFYNDKDIKKFFSKFINLKEIELKNIIIPDELIPNNIILTLNFHNIYNGGYYVCVCYVDEFLHYSYSKYEFNLNDINIPKKTNKLILNNFNNKYNIKKEYLDKFFEDLPNLKELEIINNKNIEILTYFNLNKLLKLSLIDYNIDFNEFFNNLLEKDIKINNLRELKICGNKKLRDISFINRLDNLETLIIKNCENIEVPENYSNIKNFIVHTSKYSTDKSTLKFIGEDLQNTIINEKKAISKKKLKFYYNTNINLQNFKNCINIEELIFYYCKNIIHINVLENFKNLKKIYLYNCDIFEIPNNFNITDLIIFRCNNIKELPYSLINLKNLEIKNCKNIINIPNTYINLKKLKLFVCDNIKEIPYLENLKKLELYYCDNLLNIPDKLFNLIELRIKNCDKLLKLPQLDNLINLKKLEINTCENIHIIPNLINVNELILEGLELNYLPILNNIPYYLNIYCCYNNPILGFSNCISYNKDRTLYYFNRYKHLQIKEITNTNEITDINETIDINEINEIKEIIILLFIFIFLYFIFIY